MATTTMATTNWTPPAPGSLGLSAWTAQTLRPYQQRGYDEAMAVAAKPRGRALWCAPTGSGKGSLQMAVLGALPGAWLITPSLEILRGNLARVGVRIPEGAGETALHRAAEERRMTTPVRLRNRVRAGRIAPPTVLMVDEAHHSVEDGKVAGELLELAPDAAWLGWTATPYRGSHDETDALRAFWGEPRVLLTVKDAAAGGWFSVPVPATLGLLDDNDVKVVRGEYDVDDAARLALEQRVWEKAAGHAAGTWVADGRWTRPTLWAVPSAKAREDCVAALREAGCPAAEISGETPTAEREALLSACRAGDLALVQIQVLAEGVDMPWLRRLVDARPIRSPVAWMQLLGRATRPVRADELPPEYICLCRNLERHSYLLGDAWPARKAAEEAQIAFGGGGGGGGALDRGLAKEALARRSRERVALLGGGEAEVVHLGDGFGAEVLAVAVPGEAEPRTYRRQNDREGGRWGQWVRQPLEKGGYKGWGKPAKNPALSENQERWWRRDGARYGLDPAKPPTRQGFPILPALACVGDTLAPKLAPASLATIGRSADAARDEIRAQGREVTDAGARAIAQAQIDRETRDAPHVPVVDDPTLGRPAVWPASWAKLRDGTWGARVRLEGRSARLVAEGDPLDVRNATGDVKRRGVDRVLWADDHQGIALCSVRDIAPGADLPPGVPAGRYAVTSDAGHLSFYRLREHGDLYLIVGGRGEWQRIQGPMRATILAKIAADPREAAVRYGREIGCCGCCGAELTNEASRTLGIGPVCATKHGW